MKKIIILGLLLGITQVYAQEVELKDDKVIIDGKEILKYEKVNNGQYSFFNNADDEILMYKYQNNQTQELIEDDYITFNFLTLKKKVQTSDFSLIYASSSKKSMQKLIKLLLKEKVLDLTGTMNDEKLDIFIEKYNQVIK
ncbi:hypothetical protein ACFO3U_08755 [Flavobacterium ponti]|jgi:hypothetical protein|uniref:DUF4369 domain-containing protein n=1 Tax=Flavobacterium ponti TaxID=665133 RepID=A0ABV9P3Y9_9FLAO